MAFSSCFTQAQLSCKVSCLGSGSGISCSMGVNQSSIVAFKIMKTEFAGRAGGIGAKLTSDRNFFGKATVVAHPNLGRAADCRKSSRPYVSCLPSSQLASSVFTLGTAVVLPFYTLMVAAPKAELTKKLMGSSIPYIVLGLLYAYLLYLSWTPDTIHLMFASKYWLPELASIAKLFSSEMTLASAWIHLLVIDLYAARQVFHDGLQDNVETRHSVSLCLLFCPIGVLAHFLTKALTERRREGIH